MSNLLEKSLIIFFSIVIFSMSIAYLIDKVIPMIKQLYEVVFRLITS
ncbi:MAG: hypothetical protein QXS51_02085 [Thermoproteota archaeon]|nr:hypothetical protein [Candidatus Brockarchaeota archaeon]